MPISTRLLNYPADLTFGFACKNDESRTTRLENRTIKEWCLLSSSLSYPPPQTWLSSNVPRIGSLWKKNLPGVASHLASTAFSFRSNSSAALTSPSACPCQGSAQRSHGCSTGKKNRRMWVDEPDVRRAGLSERQREMNVGPLLGISVFPAALLLP